MATHDTLGRAYARLSETKAGDMLVPDDGFGCIAGSDAVPVKEGKHGLYVDCEEGEHYLCDQVGANEDDDDDHIDGMFRGDATATVTLTHRQLKLVRDAIDIAYADHDAPAYEDHPDGHAEIGKLATLLGMDHPHPAPC